MTSIRPASRLRIFRSRNTEAFRARRSCRPILEAMEDRTLLSPGQLDPSFGYQGVVTLPYAAADVISYPDGRFLLSGTRAFGNGNQAPYVQRYTAEGQLDPTFGTLGTADDSSNVFAGNLGGSGLGLEPDGKIIQVVQYNVGAQLVRYNPDGTPDLTFGTSGATAPLDFNVNGQMDPLISSTLAVLPDGRILLGGWVLNTGTVGLAMYSADGTLDPTFNKNGTVLATAESGLLAGMAVVNNKILVLSTTGAVGYLQRFNLDGSLDTTFGTGGVITTPVNLEGSLAVQADGKILVSGMFEGDLIFARFNSDGSADQSFGTGGQATPSEGYDFVGNVALQPDGKILIPTDSQVGSGFQPAILRLDADGSLDPSFGDDGVSTFAFQAINGGTLISSLAVQGSGRVIGDVGYGGTGPFELLGVVGDTVVTLGGATSLATTSGILTAEYDVSETTGAAKITLQRRGDLSQTLSVPFYTDDSGGRAGVNYTSVNTTVTFAAGSETASVTIPILDDPSASAPVDVPLVLGMPSDGAILGNVAAGDLHITPVEGIIVTPTQISSVMQGGAGSSFTVALQSVPTGNVIVPLSISTTDPAATLSGSTLTFTPANALTPQTVTVTAAGGSGSSPAIATVSVGPATSTDPKYNGLAGGSATVGVYGSSASSPGSIEFAAANFTDDEDAGTAQITILRLGGSSGSVSVHFATSDGTYAAAGKYTPLSGSISFGATVTSKTITITLIDPGHNLQGDQTVDLTLSNPTAGAQLGVFPAATLTLHDTSRPVAGDLDPTFGADGKSILPDSLATPSVIASQSDGKLVIAGTGGTTSDGTALVRVWRTDASGQPDLGFGLQGLALIPFTNFVQVKGVAVGPDGKIVVVGTATKPSGGSEFALLRLNADGSLDTGFGQGGLVTTSFSPGDDIPVAVFVESDDSIYVAGAVDTANDASQPFAFTHYGPDGSVDIGFGDGGAMIIPAVVSPASAVLQQPDGKWLVIGGGGYDANSGGYLPGFAVRLDSDFTLDSAFGTAGIATLTWSDFYSSATVQPDGGILIGGGYAQSGVATLGRLNPDGSLDTTFGSGGSVSTVFNVPVGGDFGITSSFSSIFAGPDGKIVAIGSADDVGAIGGYFTAEARYNSDGSPDTSFADGGSRWFSIGGDGNDYGAGAVALANGDIAIAATSDNLPVLVSILTAGSQAMPIITWANPADIVYGTALGGTQLDATANVPGTFTYTPAAGTVLGAANNQTLSVSFAPTEATDYTSASASASVTINVLQADPTITWANPADIVYGTPLSSTQLDATSSVTGTFAYSSAAGTVLPAGTDTLSVNFTPTDTTDYNAAQDSVPIDVAQATPTVSVIDLNGVYRGTAFEAAATVAGVSGSPTSSLEGVIPSLTYYSGTYTSDSQLVGVQSLSGAPIQAGSYTVLAGFAGSADYTIALALSNFTISPAAPALTWPSQANIVYGTPLSGTQLDAVSSVPGTFTYSPAAGTILHADPNQTLSVTFTPTDTADYTANTAKAYIDVTQATPTVTWAAPADITFPTPLGPVQLDASASVAGTFVYTPAANTILSSGQIQVLSVTFTPTDTADYSLVTTKTTINVLAGQKVTPIITWSDPVGIVYGTPLGAAQLDATASVFGAFTYTPAAGTILSAGANQALAVSFTPTDTTDYTTATASVRINVIALSPPPPPPHVTGVVSVTRTIKGLTSITVGFDETLLAQSASLPAHYSVFGAAKKHGKTVYTKGVGKWKISFDGQSKVTIKLAKPYKGAVQVTVHGGIVATDGALSSGDFTAVIV